MSISLETIQRARACIEPHVYRTPVTHSRALSRRFNCEVFLKLENWQKTGSFKVRGALNKILTLAEDESRRGIITASAGNHGLGVAYAATVCGIAATIVVPENVSEAKHNALANYDVQLLCKGGDYDEAEEYACELQVQGGLAFVHAFDDPDVICGQGTLALEVLEDLPKAATVVVPVGGGGLICGVGCAIKAIEPTVNILGVQSEASPAMVAALRAGHVVESPIAETLADGLAGRFVCERTLALTRKYVDEVVLVPENAIAAAVAEMFAAEDFVIEGSAAVTLAALSSSKVDFTGPVVLVLTGRNLAGDVLKRIL